MTNDAAVHHDPLPVLVVVDPDIVQPRVGEVGLVVPQHDQLLIDTAQPAVFVGVDLGPVQFRAFKCCRVLRVGDLVGVPSVLGEFALAALGGGPGQIGLGMAGEELERR